MDHEGYKIEPQGSFPMVVIKRKGSGPVPKELRGMFGTTLEASKNIDGYLRSKKGKSNAKSGSSSTS